MFVVELKIIDGNPFVLLPPTVLTDVFEAAGHSKGRSRCEAPSTRSRISRRW